MSNRPLNKFETSFTAAEDDKLIQIVKDLPTLWDPKAPDFRYRVVREALWLRVSELMGNRGVRSVRTRWKTIRDSYRKTIKKILATHQYADGSSFEVVSRSKYNDVKLSFLIESFRDTPDTKYSSLTEVGNGSGIGNESTDDLVYYYQNNNLSYQNSDVQMEQTPEYESSDSDVEIIQINDDDDDDQGQNDNNDDIQEVEEGEEEEDQEAEKSDNETKHNKPIDINVKVENTDDPIDMFFQSMAKTAKSLPPKYIPEMRMRVCEIISELEMRAMKEANNT